jgi:hypothetical protein
LTDISVEAPASIIRAVKETVLDDVNWIHLTQDSDYQLFKKDSAP